MSMTPENLAVVQTNECNRLDSFHAGQVWKSPRGFLWRVIGVKRGWIAVLRKGEDGKGRKLIKDWDAVVGWTIHSDIDG